MSSQVKSAYLAFRRNGVCALSALVRAKASCRFYGRLTVRQVKAVLLDVTA